MRLDSALVARGLAKSRARAKALIKQHCVVVNGVVVNKPALAVTEQDELAITKQLNPFVGRGGLKLAGALDQFQIDVMGKVCLDIGASTGGFTDCLLQRGAKRVYALDVGTDQLDKTLLADARVVNMSNTNIRNVERTNFDTTIDFIAVDVSFISLRLVIPVVRKLFNDNSVALFLVKPQFEVGKAATRKGIVKNAKQHCEVLDFFVEQCNNYQLCVRNITFSGIKGSRGNIEFIAEVTFCSSNNKRWDYGKIESVVKCAHRHFKTGKN